MHTPVTAFYGGLLALFFFYLTILVINGRFSKKIALGDDGDKHFLQLIRSHGNFAEYTPLILILLLVAELNATQPLWLHIMGSSLLLGRILHSFGLRRHAGTSWQRISGMLLTFVALISGAVLNLLLLY
ncbi:MAG: MAPEG family protein [Paraglaciecola sp.]|uniref:MAPEG family protein n=1 Tax=Pseudomonadati TaxID=3379134 RepID=UPI00273E84FD|nr:MAPEG family protein [Paraglaciecola sp.]MDP5028980.1 MAPEG family protein [Paraglaciecola sp.]MDP5041664.1 MAPEG family protein [Paraglaciecola sp.]MDP5130837.1 MAPEG family protein [Paraglaciecola sp.]